MQQTEENYHIISFRNSFRRKMRSFRNKEWVGTRIEEQEEKDELDEQEEEKCDQRQIEAIVDYQVSAWGWGYGVC